MYQYKIRPDGFKEIKKQALLKTLPILLIAVTVGITISLINSKAKASDVNVLPIVIPLIAVSVGFGLYRGLNRQKGLLESYTLTLTNNLITREQLNTPTISIYFNEVKKIIKNKNGSFVIKGRDSTDLIGIPAQIENHSQLEERLNQIRPIEATASETLLEKYLLLFVLLTLGLMVCVFTLTNKIIVACSGSLLIVILMWCFYEIRRSKNIDAKTKRSIWLLLIVLASLIGVMIIKLMGFQKT